MTHSITPQNILDFWFTEVDSKLWWTKDAAFDALISEQFADVHAQANRGELEVRLLSPQGLRVRR